MSLHDRIAGSALTEFGLGAASAWDQVNPAGVGKQSRRVLGAVPLPLRRKLKKGEPLNTDLFTVDDPATDEVGEIGEQAGLFEALNNPLPLKWAGALKASFEIPGKNGEVHRFVIDATKERVKKVRGRPASRPYTVEFARKEGDKLHMELGGGTGNPKDVFRIFATARAFVAQLVSKLGKGVNMVRFLAKSGEPTRVKLYRRLSRLLKKELGWDRTGEMAVGGYVVFAVIQHPKKAAPALAEDRGPLKERGPLKTISPRRTAETGIKTLYIFDMDDTLIRQPHKEKGMAAYERATGKKWPYKRWWSVSATLLPPFKPNPKPAIKGAYMRAKNDAHGFVIIMTGRMNTPDMRKAVSKALKGAGYGGHTHGHDLFLKNTNAPDTGAWKLKMVRGFTKRFPGVATIRMWDDRGDHVEHFKKQIKDLGREAHVTHVTERVARLYDRVVESYPNRMRGQARDMPVPTNSEPDTSDQEDGIEEPMDNPLPGNTDLKALHRAGGSKAHQRLRPPRPPR